MKHLSILYKIAPVPAGKHAVRYAKKISFNKVIYTRHKNEAKRVGLFYAIVYSIVFGLSIGSYTEKDEPGTIEVNNAKFIAQREQQYN